nr:signal peptidase I [Candidatus Njordarchaeota archaeon]
MSKKKGTNVKEVVKLVAVIGIVVGVILGVNLGLQVVMGTPIPMVVVTSGSMEPTLYRGDICIIQKVTPDQYVVGNHTTRTGDIVIYDATGLAQGTYSSGEPIIHRVVSRKYDNATGHYFFLMQGDNVLSNPDPDADWVEDTRVYGKVIFTIPWVGNIFLFLREGGYWILIAALAVIIVLVFISETSKIDKKVKEKLEPSSSSAGSSLLVGSVSRTGADRNELVLRFLLSTSYNDSIVVKFFRLSYRHFF